MRGYRGIKYTLFIFCYFFWVVSAVLIAVGIYAKIAKEKDVVDTLMVDPALLLIIVGSVMFVITFLGCFGALRNATCLLKTFLVILAVIFILQIAAGVVGYLFTDMVMERTEKLMMTAIVRYREDRDLENAIDFVQKKFQCCGVEGYKDWSQNPYFNCSDTNPSLEACGVPFSCCIHLKNQTVHNTMCGYGMQREKEGLARNNIFTLGCLEKILLWAKNNLRLVGGLTAGLLLLEVCMMSLAIAQTSWIKKVQKKTDDKTAERKSGRKESYEFPDFPGFE
ncbi:Tetraspanin-33 [Oryzias melastigma]|uniref:Tetraspanin n=1 Tax=Oryzias melastigma TaxID=30732 RepID=A0A834CKY2_ORYME|nr:tetraspanin-33 [Oryzias melastigma]KAF6728696.1 Tetraspanin-33 [Oryzias melastigma]